MLILIPLLPFAGFLLNASFGRRLSKTISGAVACGVMLASFGVSAVAGSSLLSRPEDERVIRSLPEKYRARIREGETELIELLNRAHVIHADRVARREAGLPYRM